MPIQVSNAVEAYSANPVVYWSWHWTHFYSVTNSEPWPLDYFFRCQKKTYIMWVQEYLDMIKVDTVACVFTGEFHSKILFAYSYFNWNENT